MQNDKNNFKAIIDMHPHGCALSNCTACLSQSSKEQNTKLKPQALVKELAKAFEAQQLIVHYQPKYSLQDESLICVEALVRWQHSLHGLLLPEQFLQLMQQQGLMPRLDQYVWRKACAQLQQWHQQGNNNLQLSLNVSPQSLEYYTLPKLFAELAQEYAIKPEQLHLEISESFYLQNPTKAIAVLAALRKAGFIIDLDDFGTGYSSFTMLSQLPLDVLKLDTAFVHAETAKPYDTSLLNEIINIAHRLDLSVVAECVETREQMKRLRVMDCEYTQGFFFAKPMPVAELDQLLQTQRVHKPRLLSGFFPQGKSHRILVIDESSHYAELIKESFGEHYDVLYVDTAEAALSLLGSDEHNISAAILSMTMPTNGAALIFKQIRQQPGNWHIPIIATIPNGNVACKYPLLQEADDFLCKAHPISDLHKRVNALLDMLAFDERERILQETASRDFMTGLYNRRGLQAALASLRSDDLPAALCLFDLDNLKLVNDTYGHEAGDRFIEAFADVLRHNTRLDDIQCRYGGDEFILILKRIDDEQAVLKKAEEILTAFTQVHIEDDVQPSASVGIVICDAEHRPTAHFIEKADKAMYKAKTSQRGSCIIWHGDLN